MVFNSELAADKQNLVFTTQISVCETSDDMNTPNWEDLAKEESSCKQPLNNDEIRLRQLDD
uniref:Uncharacterized protein n=1 Tax=Arion vulgaris TaxID=1028688 RepID=A0A0B7B319_9EUPU